MHFWASEIKLKEYKVTTFVIIKNYVFNNSFWFEFLNFLWKRLWPISTITQKCIKFLSQPELWKYEALFNYFYQFFQLTFSGTPRLFRLHPSDWWNYTEWAVSMHLQLVITLIFKIINTSLTLCGINASMKSKFSIEGFIKHWCAGCYEFGLRQENRHQR